MANNVTAYIGVGSNIDPLKNIENALKRLTKLVKVTGISTFYKTLPIGVTEQEDFMNGVFQISTLMSARTLKFRILRPIESALHREKTVIPYGPRTIDLDLLLRGEDVILDLEFKVPDPDIYERPFIAFPLLELEPDLILPDTGQSISEVAKTMSKELLKPDFQFTQLLQRSIQ